MCGVKLIVGRLAVDTLVAEFRHAVVTGIICSEKVGAPDAVELHEVAHDVCGYHNLRYASCCKNGYFVVSFSLVCCEHHVVFALCSFVAALNPVATVAGERCHGYAVAAHHAVYVGPCACPYAFGRVDYRCA